MKTFVRLFAVLMLIVGCFGFVGQPPASALSLTDLSLSSPSVLAVEARLNPADEKLRTEFGKLLDLNNSDIRDFRNLPGFYPTLASKIIKASPYEQVEDVLNIPGLSERQKERLQANLDKFTVTPPAKEFIEGGDRINPGVY